MRIISTKLHAPVDYIVGILLIAAPWIFNYSHVDGAMWTRLSRASRCSARRGDGRPGVEDLGETVERLAAAGRPSEAEAPAFLDG